MARATKAASALDRVVMGVDPAHPHAWETLLFRPQPGHPGTQNPPDHLIMDLFWMPVIEPYAISEPLATAGKLGGLRGRMTPR